MRPEDTEMIANICSFERVEAAINEFQSFKAPGPDRLYPVLLQKGWNQLKGYYHVIFQAYLKPHLHGRLFCVQFFDRNGYGRVAFTQRGFDHDNWDLIDGSNCLKLFSYQYCYN